MKSYLIFNLNNKFISSRNTNLLYDFFTQFNISGPLKNSILQRVNAEINFELSVSELQQLEVAASEKIDELVADVNFNPFKERLRRLYPLQYGSDPFIWKGLTYYLYVKTNTIDSQISEIRSFLAQIKEFTNQNQPMQYIFKD